VFAVRDDTVNVYVARSGDGYILFDAGAKAGAVMAGLGNVGVDPAKVQAVFLTHTDFDHVAAVGKFPNATVYISESEADMVNGKVRRALFFSNALKVPYKTIGDGDIVSVADRSVAAIVTPGHTAGSACYLLDGTYLVTGDNLSVIDGKIGHFAEFFNMDTGEQDRVIDTLVRNPELSGVTTLLTAHYGVATDAGRLFAERAARKEEGL
jgi:glyoxylase-like metal-dependent hydrolase (beta-lactamase superfamily II)